MSESLYMEHILDHYRNPRKFGNIDAVSKEDFNPLCGDRTKVFVEISNGRIKRISFIGSGCAISVASASILMEYVEGKSIKTIMKMNTQTMQKLLGINVAAARVKCMMLALNVLKGILYDAKN